MTITTASALRAAGLDPEGVDKQIRDAFTEDLAYGPDATTTATIAAEASASAAIVARESGCLAGVPVALRALEIMAETDDIALELEVIRTDGALVTSGDKVLTATGPVRTLLTAERTTLNFLSQLSGVATATNKWVDVLQGTGAKIRDTRKTIPGMRALQKYAVRCGGGVNHRMGLGDTILIKDNHIAAANSLSAAFGAAREHFPELDVEVECDTLEQVAEAVEVGAQLILLDNMSPEVVSEAVSIARPKGVRTEASGGITIDNARAYSATGVDYIAVGALTHSSRVLDLGFDL